MYTPFSTLALPTIIILSSRSLGLIPEYGIKVLFSVIAQKQPFALASTARPSELPLPED